MTETHKKTFSHFDDDGNAHMVDVSNKSSTTREARASGAITLSTEAYDLVKEGKMSKGDVLGVARIAGIMAAKKVDQLVPLAHPLNISKASVDFTFNDEYCIITIYATVKIVGQTGVEMEALTAVTAAALTIYDMCKAVDKSMIINDIKLLKKTGGKSGTYTRNK